MRKHSIQRHVGRHGREITHLLIELWRLVRCAFYRCHGPSHEHIARRRTRHRRLRHSRDSPSGNNGIGRDRRTANRPGDTVLGHLRRVVSATLAGRRHARQVHCLPHPVAPDILRQFRIVNKRIAVVLDAIDGLVAVDLLLRYRILTMPVQEEREAVGRQVRRVGREHLGAVAGVQHVVAIARHHIEERTGEITLILIVGFVTRTNTTRSRTAQFTESVVLRVLRETAESAAYHAIRIVRSQVIDTRIRRIDVKQVRHHRSATQPRLANQVLLVPSVANGRLRHVGMRHIVRTGRVHIP